MANGKIVFNDKIIKKAYICDKKLKQIYLNGVFYLPLDEEQFEHYNLTGLTNVDVVKQTTAPVLSDISLVGSYYQSISHTQSNTGYETKYRTITPPDKSEQIKAEYPSTPTGLTANGTSTYGFLILGAFNNIPTNSSLKQVIVNIQSATSAGAAYQIFRYADSAVLASGSSDGSHVPPWYNSHDIGTDGRNYSLGIRCTTAGYMNLYGISYTAKYNSYQEAYQEPYTYYTYYTNALFKSGKIKINSNTAELIIENNQRTINSLKGYLASNNSLKGNLLTNQNVKNVVINGWGGNEYLMELDYTVSNSSTAATYNLFTDLYLKNIYNDITLEDVNYELEMYVNHGLAQSQVNTLVSEDNVNRNIYRRRIVVTNFPKDEKKLKKVLRSDFKNVRFVLKGEKVLLNHSVDSNGNFIIEMPNQYLKANENKINVVILPMDYEYGNYNIDLSLPILTSSEINYELF